jgi:polyisoprenyl-teichoic acid--peptidoglycan teichoic acid transferase
VSVDVAARRSAGPRARRRAQERRRRRLRRVLGSLATILAVGGLVAGATILVTGQDPEPASPLPADTDPAVGDEPEQSTLLLVREAAGGGPALGVTLLASGSEDVPSAVVFVPVGTLLDVPGVGLERLDRAHQYGGAPLVAAAIGNVLGIDLDHVATLSESALGTWLGRTGGLTVAVSERLVLRDDDGSGTVRFEPGEQFLDGRRLAEYWGFRSSNEDELRAFPRQQLVLTGLLEAVRDEPGLLDGLSGSQLDTTASSGWVHEILADLARAHGQGRLVFTLMPVEPFGGSGPDGSASYRPQERGVNELVERLLAPSVPADGGPRAIRVQVLNGVGVPGVGQEVDRRLRGSGARIILTDNARSFDFTRTEILVYDESPEMLAAAERVQEHLGVGRIAVSRQPQTVVDLTIVVGADFLRPRSRPAEQ